MTCESQKRFLIQVAYYGVIVIGVCLAARYLLSPLMPFILGFFIAALLRRPTVCLSRTFHISQRIPAVLLDTAFYFLTAGILLLAGIQVASAVRDLIPKLPALYADVVVPLIDSCFEQIEVYLSQLSPAMATDFEIWRSEFSVSMGQILSSLSTTAAKTVSEWAADLPMTILRAVLTVISTFFISLDYERIVSTLMNLLPSKARRFMQQVQMKLTASIKIFIKSYSLIILMTFAELSIGFSLMKIPYAIGIALVVAVIDILPVLGTGMILLPWAALAAIIGNAGLAIGMLVLYILITVIRNTVEPKLVGRQMGLHPLATLVSMFLGMQLCGLVGLIVFPLGLSLMVQFRKDGVFSAAS